MHIKFIDNSNEKIIDLDVNFWRIYAVYNSITYLKNNKEPWEIYISYDIEHSLKGELVYLVTHWNRIQITDIY